MFRVIVFFMMEIQNGDNRKRECWRNAIRLGGEHFLESWVKCQLDDIIDQFHVWYLVKDAGGYEGGVAYQVPCPSPS